METVNRSGLPGSNVFSAAPEDLLPNQFVVESTALESHLRSC